MKKFKAEGKSQFKFVKTAQESVKTGHVYLNIYSDQADGEIGIIASMFKEMADAFSQIEGSNYQLQFQSRRGSRLICNSNSITNLLILYPKSHFQIRIF